VIELPPCKAGVGELDAGKCHYNLRWYGECGCGCYCLNRLAGGCYAGIVELASFYVDTGIGFSRDQEKSFKNIWSRIASASGWLERSLNLLGMDLGLGALAKEDEVWTFMG